MDDTIVNPEIKAAAARGDEAVANAKALVATLGDLVAQRGQTLELTQRLVWDLRDEKGRLEHELAATREDAFQLGLRAERLETEGRQLLDQHHRLIDLFNVLIKAVGDKTRDMIADDKRIEIALALAESNATFGESAEQAEAPAEPAPEPVMPQVQGFHVVATAAPSEPVHEAVAVASEPTGDVERDIAAAVSLPTFLHRQERQSAPVDADEEDIGNRVKSTLERFGALLPARSRAAAV